MSSVGNTDALGIELFEIDSSNKLQKEVRKIRTGGDLFSEDEAVQQAADKS